jgi:hypothetical protein
MMHLQTVSLLHTTFRLAVAVYVGCDIQLLQSSLVDMAGRQNPQHQQSHKVF